MGHHDTSTSPGSPFTTGFVLGRHVPGRHVTVTHQSLTTRTPGKPTEHRPLRAGEIGEWLSTLEVHLGSEERTRLVEKVRDLSS